MSDIDPNKIAEALAALPKQHLEMAMDLDQRVCFAVLTQERAKFAIADPEPTIIPIPFHILKSAVAQVISAEVDLNLMKLPGGLNTPRKRWPRGLQGAKHVAELLADAAGLEEAGQAVLDEGQPAAKPNLGLVLGGEDPAI